MTKKKIKDLTLTKCFMICVKYHDCKVRPLSIKITRRKVDCIKMYLYSRDLEKEVEVDE